MAKHITKSVIEDIAYELKRVGLITKAYEDKNISEEMLDNFGTVDDFDTSGTGTVDWITENIIEVLVNHDPTFEPKRFRKQAQFRIEI